MYQSVELWSVWKESPHLAPCVEQEHFNWSIDCESTADASDALQQGQKAQLSPANPVNQSKTTIRQGLVSKEGKEGPTCQRWIRLEQVQGYGITLCRNATVWPRQVDGSVKRIQGSSVCTVSKDVSGRCRSTSSIQRRQKDHLQRLLLDDLSSGSHSVQSFIKILRERLD